MEDRSQEEAWDLSVDVHVRHSCVVVNWVCLARRASSYNPSAARCPR